jgi:hypothetical protein
MAYFVNVIDLTGFKYDAALGPTAVVLQDAMVLPRTMYPMPFNVQGFADTRPRTGQLWPRGDGQSYGA